MKGMVQMLIDPKIQADLLEDMVDDYLPSYIFLPNEKKINLNNYEFFLNLKNHRILKLKSKGIKRIFELNVSGAFHSPLMKNVRISLEECINCTVFHNTKIPLYQNFDPKENFHAEKIKDNLIKQIDNPVRWFEIIKNMDKNNIKTFIEVGPKDILTKLNKNIVPNQYSYSIESKDGFS